VLRIKKLDIFIAKQFGLLFVGTFFICQFVLMMQFLWRYVDDLIGKGLSLGIMAQFFWYMGLMLMPQAFPLAILLSSLITFGNMGESSELTAIKAAGISLMQSFRSLIAIVILVSLTSFYFQNVIGPEANKSFGQLLLSMKQKSPELEIPEGVFYDGIPNCNIYVQKKDMKTGKLYGIMIYRIQKSYEDAAIILADSGMLQSTAEKKHLLLHLWNGEWFENMQSQDIAGSSSVPYRRETFGSKRIVLDFDGGFNMADVGGIAADARSKSLSKIITDLDSIKEYNDSVGHSFYKNALQFSYSRPPLQRNDSAKIRKLVAQETASDNIDTLFSKLNPMDKKEVVKAAINEIQMTQQDLQMKRDYSADLSRNVRLHQLEAINKFTLSLSCIIFFFIGAPLGAIIRKGGLGVPVIISVLVFIVFYIFDNSGMKMARDDNWTVWFGKLLGTAVLAPIAVFFTYKANNDSTVFNFDLYKHFFCRLFGIRQKRHIFKKEVIINDPEYLNDKMALLDINDKVVAYSKAHNLLKAPNPIKVFFHQGDDRSIRDISNRLEKVIEDLGNSKDKIILHELNTIPFVATHAHTRPFKNKWANLATGIIIPLGLFFYLRMVRYRLRLMKDLKLIRRACENITERIDNRPELYS
jgi:lipopolysaccharide export system permease protein